jgi:hypothetical protein
MYCKDAWRVSVCLSSAASGTSPPAPNLVIGVRAGPGGTIVVLSRIIENRLSSGGPLSTNMIVHGHKDGDIWATANNEERPRLPRGYAN